MIEINGLTKYFYPHKSWRDFIIASGIKPTVALEGINLTINAGEIFGLIGSNGAGKTTLLKILATLILPDQGSATINKHDIVEEFEYTKHFIGLVTGDERSFYWRLTGRQNLEFFGAFHGMNHAAINSRIRELVDLMHIDSLDKRVGEFSAGMKQKLNLARALLHNPSALLMDEPTKSLDPFAATGTRQFIKKELSRRQGKTILLVTHSLREIEEICDRVGIIKQGKLIAIGTPREMESQITND